jgi:hypothetical protein
LDSNAAFDHRRGTSGSRAPLRPRRAIRQDRELAERNHSTTAGRLSLWNTIPRGQGSDGSFGPWTMVATPADETRSRPPKVESAVAGTQ